MIILAKKYGRLGNRLFNSAHIVALAIETKHQFFNTSFFEYRHYFKYMENDPFCSYPKRNKASTSDVLSKLYYLLSKFAADILHIFKLVGITHPNLLTIKAPKDDNNPLIIDSVEFIKHCNLDNPKTVCFFQGWSLRGYSLLKTHRKEILNYFQPTDNYQRSINSFISENRGNCDILVGIAIRHGNYRSWKNGAYFFPLESYINFMTQVKKTLTCKQIRFLIFSDEEQDINMIESAGINFTFRSGHVIENLYSLAKCDYIITAPSTYGLWASFYGNVPVCIIENANQLIEIPGSFKVCEG